MTADQGLHYVEWTVYYKMLITFIDSASSF